MIFNIGPEGVSKTKKPPAYSMSGIGNQYAYVADDPKEDGTIDWEMAIYASGTINFSRVCNVDIFLVGGGAPGGKGYPDLTDPYGERCYGGAGGYGGQCKLFSNVSLTEGVDYQITIGGSGSATSAFGETAESGLGSPGGSGGAAWHSGFNNGTSGTDGVTAFNSHPRDTGMHLISSQIGVLYGAGGGGAPARSNAGVYTRYGYGAKAGGTTGGGASGVDPTGENDRRNGLAGAAKTGAGGGGSCGDRLGEAYPNGGAGGSGIILIRNAR